LIPVLIFDKYGGGEGKKLQKTKMWQCERNKSAN
jgi:hypothetical protein